MIAVQLDEERHTRRKTKRMRWCRGKVGVSHEWGPPHVETYRFMDQRYEEELMYISTILCLRCGKKRESIN